MKHGGIYNQTLSDDLQATLQTASPTQLSTDELKRHVLRLKDPKYSFNNSTSYPSFAKIIDEANAEIVQRLSDESSKAEVASLHEIMMNAEPISKPTSDAAVHIMVWELTPTVT